jgi:uncharacterized LabA/DUF88 family protein
MSRRMIAAFNRNIKSGCMQAQKLGGRSRQCGFSPKSSRMRHRIPGVTGQWPEAAWNQDPSETNPMPASDKIAIFIDGPNLHATAKTLGFDIDYKRLLKEFQSRGTLLRAFYYTAIIEDQEYSSIRPLIDWLDYNGYTVVTKATKEFIDAIGRRKVKGNMDIELAVDAMEIAEHVDQIVLFSGNGDFRSLVEAVQRRGVRVTVISTISSQPPMIADELRRQADVFTDLVELQSKLGRDPSERPAPRRTTPPAE